MSVLTMLDKHPAPPSAAALKAVQAASVRAKTPAPGAWAFYLGGKGHNKGRGTTYTNELLDSLAEAGVVFLPIYVGALSGQSESRGVADAKDAVQLNQQFGSRNDIIAADIERGTFDADPDAAVRYINGWTKALHDAGLRSMVYGPFQFGAKLAQDGDPQPDAIWIARYRTTRADPDRDSHDIPGIPAHAFAGQGQRAWQYGGAIDGHPAKAGGLVVDISVVDVEVFAPAGGGPKRGTTRGHPQQHPAHPKPAHPKPAHPKPAHPKPAQPAAGQPPPHPSTRVIAPGDTLFALEDRLGLARGSLFAANRKVLDEKAREHGHANSDHGHFIFPGTEIVLP
jgi:hypothetical protein